MQFRQKPREDLELNLIPLIDVIFMLLIFFMLTTTFVHDRTLNVTLPVSSQSTEKRAPVKDHVIEIAQDGRIAIDGKILGADEILPVLKRIAADQQPVVVWADADVVNQKVITVLDLARKAGITKVGLGTTPVK
ncbi:biopolymer transporter ExbD [Halothiobacillus sp.]|uniref:ExbD/TolR family protein n=1 Tax=Halothiobacillus sp. TaxID=1891311 RepID=UPI002AD2AF05|nr:biopolymer transporter ExbD [Halothiobacillus sp.]